MVHSQKKSKHELVREETLRIETARRSAIGAMTTFKVAQELGQTRKSQGRAELIVATPAEALPAVLMQDERVFEPLSKRAYLRVNQEDEHPSYTPITAEEYRLLAEGGFGDWVMVTQYSEVMAEPIAFGLRAFVHRINAEEIIERVSSILQNENDEEWKKESLNGISVHYLAYAIRVAEEDGDSDIDFLREIGVVDRDLAASIYSFRDMSRHDLHLRALEDRAEWRASNLEQMRLEREAAEAEANAAQVAAIPERKEAEDALAEARAYIERMKKGE
ncbi:hypothetical protein HYV73_03060 [Candidatus Uhrbacteria bacterium]|nr:hypothetical protein [Candidatus Uhrbacteria bacterium]